MRGALADRRFRRLLIGQSLSTFGDTALYLTLGIWAKSLTHSNAAAGSVFLALGIPALFGPLTGHLADRLPRRPVLIGANAATALIVLSLLAVHSRAQLWIIYLVAFCYGISFSVLGAAGAGLRKDMLRGEHLAAANAIGALVSINVEESGPRAAASAPSAISAPTATGGPSATSGTGGATEPSGASRKPPSFFGIYGAVQGAGAIAGGIPLAFAVRKLGSARVVGFALAAFSLASAAWLTSLLWLVLAAALADGIGLVWLVAAATTATQRYTPASLQGRVNAAFMMLIITPQTVSIAAGAALISVVDYRLMLAVVAVAIGACALVLLTRPAAEPAGEATEATDATEALASA